MASLGTPLGAIRPGFSGRKPSGIAAATAIGRGEAVSSSIPARCNLGGYLAPLVQVAQSKGMFCQILGGEEYTASSEGAYRALLELGARRAILAAGETPRLACQGTYLFTLCLGQCGKLEPPLPPSASRGEPGFMLLVKSMVGIAPRRKGKYAISLAFRKPRGARS